MPVTRGAGRSRGPLPPMTARAWSSRSLALRWFVDASAIVRTMPKWRTVDYLVLFAVLAVAAGVRLVDLGNPSRLVFDESYYAQDACTYLGLAKEVCGGTSEASWMHPPLGKWFIAVGIALGGYNAAAWRLPAVVAGLVCVAALYILTRRLTGSTVAAGTAAGVIALDPLSIVSSRVAMLDIFVTAAGVLAVLFAVLHRDSMAGRRADRKRLVTPWMLAAGVACGIAVATKWSGILALGTVVILIVAWELDARMEEGEFKRRLRVIAPSIVVCFVVLPALVYVASYVGRLQGELIAAPWQSDAWPRVFGGRQLRMAWFHVGLKADHPYSSPAWSWLLGKRAVTYFFEVDAAGRYRHILAFADLALWLPGLAATAWATVTLALRRQLWRADFVVAVAVAGSYVPWLVLAFGRPFTFLHYVLPTVPFLALAIGWALSRLPLAAMRWMAAGIAAVAISVTVFWAPLIYGWPLSYDDWRVRILFTDCTPDEVVNGRFAPRPHAGPPPDGWCWV
jgi:dolichyl-phosphate-mannose-protein mannosyltransferase